MKAAPLTQKPHFRLMKQNDVQSFYHMQMPRWLFFDPKYSCLSLEAKVVYTFLLNRFQLSRLNNWINEDGEVFIIYTRASLSEEMRISYRKVIESMKELAATNLIWERRCGRGDANQIYLAQVELSDESASVYESVPFISAGHEAAAPRPAEYAYLEECPTNDLMAARVADTPASPTSIRVREVRKMHVKTCRNGSSKTAAAAAQEVPGLHASNIDFKEIDNNTDNSQSIRPEDIDKQHKISDRQADDEMRELEWILEQCGLDAFVPEVSQVFSSAIERLYFTEHYRIGGAVLPKEKVRSHLRCLDYQRLREAERKIAANTGQKVHNATAYTMAVIFNSIWELESDLLLDPYLNRLKSRAPTTADSGRWY